MFWLFKKRKNLKEQFESLSENLKNSFSNVKRDIGEIHKWFYSLKEKHKKHEERFRSIEDKLKVIMEILDNKRFQVEHSKIENIQSFNHSIQPFVNVQSIKKLTPRQRDIIGLLLYAGGPMDYETMAEKLRLNVITVRRHVNDIVRFGIDLGKKVSVKNRRKMFYLKKEMREKLLRNTEIPKNKEESEGWFNI